MPIKAPAKILKIRDDWEGIWNVLPMWDILSKDGKRSVLINMRDFAIQIDRFVVVEFKKLRGKK